MAPPSASDGRRGVPWLPLLFAYGTLEVLTIALTLPSMPKLQEAVGMTFARSTWVTAAVSALGMLMGPVLGRLSDQIGRTMCLRLSSLGQMATNLALGSVGSWEAVAGARISASLTRSFTPVCFAYISDQTSPAERGKAMGVFGTSFGLAFMVGPLLGGLLETRFGLRRPYLVAAGLGLFNAWFVGMLPGGKSPPGPERGSEAAKAKAADGSRPGPTSEDISDQAEGAEQSTSSRMTHLLTNDPKLACLLLARLVLQTSQVLFESTFSQFILVVLKGDSAMRGRVMGIAGLMGIVANGVIVRKFGNAFEGPRALAALMALLAVGHVGWGLSSTSGQMSLALVPVTLAAATTITLTKSVISKSCGADIVGFVMGLSASLDSMSRIFAPPIAGYVFEHVSPRAVAFTCAGGGLLAGGIFLLVPVMSPRASDAKAAHTKAE